jgi:hypothetical protein
MPSSQAIEMPDTLEWVAGKAKQHFLIQENTVVLVTASADEQPYIGLVTRVRAGRGGRSSVG